MPKATIRVPGVLYFEVHGQGKNWDAQPRQRLRSMDIQNPIHEKARRRHETWGILPVMILLAIGMLVAAAFCIAALARCGELG